MAILTLGTGGLFKIAAFAREAFIASRFGLSNVTDAYFAFQQFPLILATFMFGAFSLAFTPVYAAEKRASGHVPWLPGLLLYGSAFGLLLTLLTAASAPTLLRAFSGTPALHGTQTLFILGAAFAPVIWLGIWAGATIANGKNLTAMFVGGLPYLFMTTLLIGLYASGALNDLSLPISFLAGFAGVGIFCFLRIAIAESPKADLRALWEPWKLPGFRRFLQLLAASSIENIGYSANQLLLVFFVAQAGTGAVSANTCAMRVGMLGFTLLGQPLAQLVQAKLCAARENERLHVFRSWLFVIAGAVCTFAVALYALREPVTSLVYLHGKFSSVELARVMEIVPAWLAYFVVSSLNAIVARYLFATSQGNGYVRRQLFAYLLANLVRVAFWGRLGAPGVIWCSVFAEGCALLVSLRSCFQSSERTVREPVLAGAQEA